MRVILPGHLDKRIKTAFKRSFPLESCVFVIGRTKRGTIYEVRDIYVPGGQEKYAKTDRIQYQHSWWDEARALARDSKLQLLGDVHSHPYTAEFYPDATAGPSADDLKDYGYVRRKTGLKIPIMGICSVFPSKRGMEARLKFWSCVKHPALIIT